MKVLPTRLHTHTHTHTHMLHHSMFTLYKYIFTENTSETNSITVNQYWGRLNRIWVWYLLIIYARHICTYYEALYTYYLFFKLYLFLALLGLHCCAWAFSICSKWGLLSSCSLRASHCGGLACCGAQAQGCMGTVAVAYGLSCPTACRILPDQGLNPHALHWQADS